LKAKEWCSTKTTIGHFTRHNHYNYSSSLHNTVLLLPVVVLEQKSMVHPRLK